MIGEMPGDDEDRSGKPFTGPAGKFLDGILEEIDLRRKDIYVTNVVKHFRWQPRGERRLHIKPSSRHILACEHWLQKELFLVQPSLIVCLGATAAQYMLGNQYRLTKQHGTIFTVDGEAPTMATYHPAAVLRAPHRSDRAKMRRLMIKDLSEASNFISRM